MGCVTVHICPQSVVLEGQYWKRRVEAVAREYRKWRIYHRDKNVSNARIFCNNDQSYSMYAQGRPVEEC